MSDLIDKTAALKIAQDIGYLDHPDSIAYAVSDAIAALPADDRVAKLVEALKPFARIADVSETAEPGESVTVNVDRCRAARAAILAMKETDQ
jgi:hypothetical protein